MCFPCELLVRILRFILVEVDKSNGASRPKKWSKTMVDYQDVRFGYASLAVFSRSCQCHYKAVNATGLWHEAVFRVLWPMCGEMSFQTGAHSSAQRDIAIAPQLHLLRQVGTWSRHLHTNCLHLRPGDFAKLVKCCPSIETIELCYFGPSGANEMEWARGWSKTLRRLSVHFWYDGGLGPPSIPKISIPKVLSEVAAHCEMLEELTLTGIDWPRAKADVYKALCIARFPLSWRALRSVRIEGLEAWTPADFRLLICRGIHVHTKVISNDMAS